MLGLTPLEETVAGQELIQLGRDEGRQEIHQKNIMQLLVARFGPVSPSIQARINVISEIVVLDQLFSDALTFTSLEQFETALPK